MSSLSVFTVKVALCSVVFMLGASLPFSDAQLDPSFYRDTCPKVHSLVREVVRNVSKSDPRILASLIRLHFHDCFVQSDQELFNTSGADTIAIVNSFSNNQTLFYENFKASMIKMSIIGALTGSQGEIRAQCNFVNGNSSSLATLATKESTDDGMVSSI
ncbi:Peroxidase 54 [Spatholobus suberectus]|nr:Peroxidase 54 [Spatholobus suberectus]